MARPSICCSGDTRRRHIRRTSTRELIFYHANHGRKPREALRIAELEIARRQDVHTRDAYAWALRANGRMREAREEMRRALDVGIRDPDVVARAAILQVRATP